MHGVPGRADDPGAQGRAVAAPPPPGAEIDLEYPAVDLSVPQFTVRAVLTGMVLGALLSLCNIYAGLKIGWGFNMSIAAALLSYGFWGAMSGLTGARHWNLLENNVNQTAASSAASISSAGLVAPIPALTMLTDRTLTWPVLSVWVLSVALVGVVVAVGLRRQMLVVDKLPFPLGVATAETLKEMYARGAEALARVKMLLAGGVLGAGLKLVVGMAKVPKLALPGQVAAAPGGALAQAGLAGPSLKNLGFALDPSVLMVGIGAIIGMRASWSVFLGGALAWGVLGPIALDAGMAEPGKADPGAGWFGPMIKWMLWPGVAMMVTASMTAFAFSWRSVLNAMRGARAAAGGSGAGAEHDVPRRLFFGALLVALVASVVLQGLIFDIGVFVASVGVMLTFALAIVAGRVSGETGITPVGAMGKVTQLTFGAIAPGDPTANLMAANVTGGAASQCGDLLHDLKCGMMVGASPRYLAYAQVFGVLAGSLAGSAAYLLLVPDPKSMLLTDEWAAPAVAQWKAVAELFMRGLEAIPPGATEAMAWAGGIGVVLAILEKVVPKGRARSLIPSPTGIGIAIVIPPYYGLSMLLGALGAAASERVAPRWAGRFVVVLAAGFIAGESLAGIGLLVQRVFF